MKNTLPVKHIVGACIDGMQCCIICGEVIADYRNMMSADSSSPIRTWPEGDIYIVGKNPKITSTLEPKEGFTNCSS